MSAVSTSRARCRSRRSSTACARRADGSSSEELPAAARARSSLHPSASWDPDDRGLPPIDGLRLESGEILSEHGPGDHELPAYQILDFLKADAVVVAQSTFAQVAPRKREAAELFYRLLFEIDPTTRPLFAGTDLEVQGEMLMDMLAKVADGLDRLEELRPAVVELGRRHAAYGVQLRHFDAVEQALLETFRQLLGPAFTDDVRLAWSRIYNQLAGIMIEAMEAAAPPASVAQAPAGCPHGLAQKAV